MKKLFSSIIMVMMIALACVAVASAAEVYTPDADGLYTIEYDVTAEDGTQFGMVVIEATGDEAFALDEATIRYIDQVGAEDGTIAFDAFIPMDLKNEGTYKVYIGGGDLDEATFIGTLGAATEEPDEPQGVLGDINGDETVDINDATELFNHSMLPEFFPISYTGNTDFEKDGVLDINDATYLFNYSMLPDFFPIEW